MAGIAKSNISGMIRKCSGQWPGKGTVLLLFLFVSLLATTGCSWKSKPILFKTVKKIKTDGQPVYRVNTTEPDSNFVYEHRIKPDDRIAVRFLNNFDISTGINFSNGAGNESEMGFLVSSEGKVRLPLLGQVYVQDCTRSSAAIMLEEAYAEHIREPNIEVSILNRSVNILGEVESPGVFLLNQERTNLVEVLAMANGPTKYAKLKSVKVIRGDLTDPEVIVFDLTNIQSLEAEDLIVHDNDIIYVEPRNVKLVGDAILPYTTLISAITGIAATIVLIRIRTL